MVSMESRVLGGILGLVVGDALGAPLEMATAEFIEENFGTVDYYIDVYHWKGELIPNWQVGSWTDDSAFMQFLILDKTLNIRS